MEEKWTQYLEQSKLIFWSVYQTINKMKIMKEKWIKLTTEKNTKLYYPQEEKVWIKENIKQIDAETSRREIMHKRIQKQTLSEI